MRSNLRDSGNPGPPGCRSDAIDFPRRGGAAPGTRRSWESVRIHYRMSLLTLPGPLKASSPSSVGWRCFGGKGKDTARPLSSEPCRDRCCECRLSRFADVACRSEDARGMSTPVFGVDDVYSCGLGLGCLFSILLFCGLSCLALYLEHLPPQTFCCLRPAEVQRLREHGYLVLNLMGFRMR